MLNEHWGFTNFKNGYANIYCPTFTEDRVGGYQMRKNIYKCFKDLESLLKETNYVGWVTWTKLENPHIMKFLKKVGANPYEIDIKFETIWFKKDF